ncbi:gamma-glutamylcyclotransferase family protein [Actinocorallia longicatena]|uniref:Putative gamma-glutamylcyclotransferase n=1 Tax=Actinocorallia longicatena TaxID=111803 RepID=A0ABP6QFP0_9ACTN
MSDLFVYGTLRFPDVLSALLGRVPVMSPGRVEGWRVAALAGRVYPGLVRAEGAAAEGVVLSGLSEDELVVLHAYEDVEYDIAVLDLTDGRPALAYLWKGEALAADWDVAGFATTELAAYVPGCAEWRSTFRG